MCCLAIASFTPVKLSMSAVRLSLLTTLRASQAVVLSSIALSTCSWVMTKNWFGALFALLRRHDFRIDATILEKRKARPHVRPDDPTFYQYAWHYHAKYLVPRSVVDGHDLFICAAALETSKGKAAFKLAFNNVIQQAAPRTRWATDFPPSASEPCLQAADYCAWAIQRKWEMGDTRSYGLIANKIATEFDLWRTGATYYYA